MTKTMQDRLKSFVWRTGGMAFVAIASYVLSIGDIWQVDVKVLTNFAVITILGLVAGEVTKFLNKG